MDLECEEGFSALGGYFHCDDDDIHRGVVLGAAELEGFFAASACEDPCKACPFEKENPFGMEVMTNHLSGDRCLSCFDEGIVAPAAPSDPFFQFEATTTFVQIGPTPAKLGNSLLALFASEATASVTKVTPKKCTMKVNIDCQGFFCELKVRIYNHSQGHAVEFQRRMGEPFVFAAIYNRAASHLEALTALRTGAMPEDKFERFTSDSSVPSSFASREEPSCKPAELILLPLLSLRKDSSRLNVFPREAPTGSTSVPVEDLSSSTTHGNFFWGPLALPQSASAA